MTYKEFIDNILNTRGRFGCGDEYHERHHIIPKCLGGRWNKDNLIDLFAREHFIAHKLLAIEHPDNVKLAQAYSMMAFPTVDTHKRYELTPEEYEEARLHLSKVLKERFKDKTTHPNYGKHLSEETRKKISEGNKGNKKCLGRIISEETRRKISEADHTQRKVIRLYDNKIYASGAEAARDNPISQSSMYYHIKHFKTDYMYYNDWVKLNKIKE